MDRRLSYAVMIMALLWGCGGSDDAPPPQVDCWPATPETSPNLMMNAPPICGSLADATNTRYWFLVYRPGTYTVTLWTKSGNVDLDVVDTYTGSYHSWNSPPQWVDAVSIPINTALSSFEITVTAPGVASTYAIQVTGP